jgi:hypothetical protein
LLSRIVSPPDLNIDAPVIRINEPQALAYLRPDLLTLNFTTTAVALGSAVANISIDIDGTPVNNGPVIDLYTLSLGSHTLKVSAVDSAGNQASQSLTFHIAATVQSLETSVNRFYAEGKIRKVGVRDSLLSKLKKGKINQLNAFINEVEAQTGKSIKPAAAALLIEDTLWLIAHL